MRSIVEDIVQIHTSYIFEILQVTNFITPRLYSPEAVAHIVVPMHPALPTTIQALQVSAYSPGATASQPPYPKWQYADT